MLKEKDSPKEPRAPASNSPAKPRYKCMTKAVSAAGDQMMYGPKWILSRRGILKVFEDRLECGDWRIDYSDIREAVLLSIRSGIIPIPGFVLRVETPAKTYHFGPNGKAVAQDLGRARRRSPARPLRPRRPRPSGGADLIAG
jgi:hypothetical protein